MALGADDVEPAELTHLVALGFALDAQLLHERLEGLGLCLRVAVLLAELPLREHLGATAEHDVGAAAGHVGRHGDRAPAAGLGDDEGLVLVVLRVEHLVLDLALREDLADGLALLDARRADEDRHARLVVLEQVVDDGGELLGLRLVDDVVEVLADDVLVRRDDDDVELVGAVELARLGVGGARHARELLVEAEEVLEGDRRHRATLFLDAHVLLRLDRLVQAVTPASAREHAAGELVDDEDLALAHQVVDVALVERVRAQTLVEDVQGLEVLGVVEVPRLEDAELAEQLLRELDAFVGERDGVALLVEVVVLLVAQLRDGLVDDLVLVARALALAADDERGARLVDEDRVDLVDDRVVQGALHVLERRELHVVAQVVEAELVVLAVGDVRLVGALLLGVALLVHDDAGGQPHEAVELAHPLRVAAREVVVHRDDVHALALEGVEVAGQGGDERLALAGAHLGDRAGVEHHAADELHVVVAHLQDAAAALAAGGEGLDEDVVDGGAVVELLLELRGLGPELFVGELLHLALELVDGDDLGLQPLDRALVRRAEELLDPGEHGWAGP